MSPDLVPSPLRETAPSVRVLLAQFHEETPQKLAIAPTDSDPIYQAADGSLSRVEDGWISDSDAELDKADAITIQPTSVVDREVDELFSGTVASANPSQPWVTEAKKPICDNGFSPGQSKPHPIRGSSQLPNADRRG